MLFITHFEFVILQKNSAILFVVHMRTLIWRKKGIRKKMNRNPLKGNSNWRWCEKMKPIQSSSFLSLLFLAKNNCFLTFPACFSIPMIFSNLNYNCSNLLDKRNLQEQVKKAFCYQKLFWPFTIWINCSSDLKDLQILGFQPRISKVFLDH